MYLFRPISSVPLNLPLPSLSPVHRGENREREKNLDLPLLPVLSPPLPVRLSPLSSLSPVDGGENRGLEEMVAVEAVVLVIMVGVSVEREDMRNVAGDHVLAVLTPPLAGDPTLLQAGEIYRSLCLTEQPDVGSGSGADVAVSESAGSLAVTVALSLPPASRKGESGAGSCAGFIHFSFEVDDNFKKLRVVQEACSIHLSLM